MTLATLLLNGFFLLFPLLAAGAQRQASPQPSDKPANSAPAQDQANPPQTPTEQSQQAPASPSTTPPAQKPSTTKQPASKPQNKKKKVIPADCNPTPANGSPSPPSDSASSDKTSADKAAADQSAGETPQKTTTPTPPSNCPPSKVIVKQGGTSEPSIQLAGGAGGAPERATANQMLQSAEQNLKKISAQQLTSSQQDMVSQVRKFMDQSKTATAAGDLERARTLAWKAQTLSEELVPPEH